MESTAAAIRTEPRTERSSREWPRGTQRLRYGGDYNPEQWPRETWLEDIELMREAGINLVSLGIFSWALLEPREGEYDFRQMDEIMDLLAGAGIDVDLATPTASPPAWFWANYPDARPVTRDGVQLGFGSRGMASPSAPQYRRAAVAITERLAERYAGHPALVMWHVHNEYGEPISESYDQHSVLAFRAWLRGRYGSIDALNTAWGTTFWGQRYGEWDEIDAPRRAATVTNPTQQLDFARFSSDALLECFRAERDAIRRWTPELAVTTNFMATNCPSMDLWAWAKEVDVVANDHYLVAARADNHILLSLDADLTRSLAGGRPWMLMEHSTSAVNWQPRNIAKRPGEMARNSFAHVARGADAVLFFQFRASRRGAEKFHSAMLPHAGRDSRLWRDVVALGARLGDLADVRGTRVTAKVAIAWDWQSFWAQDLEYRPTTGLRHRERIEAFYTALWTLGTTIDFVHPEASLDGYDVLVLPSLYLVSAAAGANIAGFVAGGGHLVVSFGSGLVDDDDAVHEGGFPGPLREPLGLTIEEILPFREGESARVGDDSTGDVWADDIRLGTAAVVEQFVDGRAAGQPAITRNAFGEGHAWYVATRLDPASLQRLLSSVLSDAGIPVEVPPVGLEIVERTGKTGTFRFLINHADAAATVSVDGRDITVAAGAVEVVQRDAQG